MDSLLDVLFFFPLQPRERVFISIAWTPPEEGRVRELITFVVNDVVKHQAVLLGSAEQPVKKKVTQQQQNTFIFPFGIWYPQSGYFIDSEALFRLWLMECSSSYIHFWWTVFCNP